MNRRKFLGSASCAGIGYTSLLSTLTNLKFMNAAAIQNSSVFGSGDYKAMVCLMLGGGNDAFNMLIPRGDAEYNEYATTRSNLAIPQNQLVPINPNTDDGKQYGLHPSMPDIGTLFEDGNLAFVSNVGSLVVPTTKTDYYNEAVPLPVGLFSHSDQQMHWQTSIPQTRGGLGWGGKIADLMSSCNLNQNISMNVSLDGTNIFQAGNNTVEYAIDPYDGSIGIVGYDDPWQFGQLRKAGIDSLLAQQYSDVFKETYVNVITVSRDAHIEFSSALNGVTLNTVFTDNDISKSFEMIAKTISVRDTLQFDRQIFFVRFGGWDHHDYILENQAAMLTIVNDALKEFWAALEELNVTNNVTTFTMSEFARTLTSNGDGTDHAWGSNVMVMGGDVSGKDIYGTYPSLGLGSAFELGNGVLLPTTSADEYFSELAMWFGVQNSDLSTVFPNLSGFYNIGGPDLPIGFMDI